MNDRPYVLISFHREQRAGKDFWLVIGHRAPGDNDILDEFPDADSAARRALSFSQMGIPAIRGRNYDALLRQLAPID